MSRQRKAKVATTPQMTLVTSPDAQRDREVFVSFGTDPYEDYLRKRDLFVRREIVYSLFERCAATSAIAQSAAAEIASQEVYVTPTQSNPSATTILLAKRAIDIMNMAMNRPGGILSFIMNYTYSYWGSKTGAFIATPRDSAGNIESISMIHPMSPRPFFGWYNVGPEAAGTPMPILSVPPGSGRGMNLADGIWYVDGGLSGRSYFALPFVEGHYWQDCPSSLGWGAFQEGKPTAEYALSEIITHIALADYMRRTILCTDDAQVVAWENVDSVTVEKKANQLRDIASRRKAGEAIDPKDEGVRLSVFAKDPDRPVNIKVINLRAFPEGFDPQKMMSFYGEQIALIFGVNPRRATPDTQKERFGNATQAAMLNSDEPGIRAIKSSLQSFFSSVLLGGLPLRSEFQSRNSAENYGIVSRDVLASQVVSQAQDGMSPEQKQAYLFRTGVLTPADIGQEALRTGDSLVTQNAMTQGFLSLRDSSGLPLTYEKASIITTRSHKAELGCGCKAIYSSVEECALEAQARYEEWVREELPTTISGVTLQRSALRNEVDDIAAELFNDLTQCAKRNGGRSSDQRVRMLYDFYKGAFYNLFGSPDIRVAAQARPQHNLFDTLWGSAGKLLVGSITMGELQAIAMRYTMHLARYYNAIQAPIIMAQFAGYDGPVEWKLGLNEDHCPVCPKFAREYPSFKELLSHTGGLLPGDIRLPDFGNCKCKVERVTTGGN